MLKLKKLYHVLWTISRNTFQCKNIFVVLFIIFSSATFGQKLQLKQIFSLNDIEYANWLVPVQLGEKRYLLANAKGEIYDINNGSINLKNRISITANNANKEFIQLTALVAHPNFNLREHKGFATFYTAHIEKFDVNIRKRLQAKNLNTEFNYDAVLTEWKLTTSQKLTFSPNNVREVLRIPLSSEGAHISQLSFDPNTKPWEESHGQLFIALNSDNELSKVPLYSGSILRVIPHKLGLKPYTIPNDNPFLRTSDINDEIYILGAQKIKQIIWSRSDKNNFFIKHEFHEKTMFSRAFMGSNWLTLKANKIANSQNYSQKIATLYLGKKLIELSNKVLILTQNKDQLALVIDNENEQTASEVITSNNYQLSNEIILGIDNDNELVLFDKYNVSLYLIGAEKEKSLKKSNEAEKNTSSPSIFSLIIFFTIVLIFLTVCFFIAYKIWKKLKQRIVKKLLLNKFDRFEVVEDKGEVLLYKRHQKSPGLTLELSQIANSQLILNDEVICTISRQNEQTIDSAIEEGIRTAFAEEKRIKMIDNRIRKLEMQFNLDKKSKHTVIFYLRKGNHRLTKPSFGNSMELAIKWLWFYSHSIDPDNIKIPEPKKKVALSKAVSKPSNDIVSGQSVDINDNNYSAVNISSEKLNSTDKTIIEQEHSSNKSTNYAINDEQLDVDIVEAIDKLANLKKQGHLSEEEFNSAKNKLLNDLIK